MHPNPAVQPSLKPIEYSSSKRKRTNLLTDNSSHATDTRGFKILIVFRIWMHLERHSIISVQDNDAVTIK